MSMVNGVILDINVDARAVRLVGLFSTTLHANCVISNVKGTVNDEHIAAIAYVNAVSILSIPRATHGYSVNNYVVTTLGYDVETRRILNGYPLNEHIVTFCNADEMSTHLLLFRGIWGYVFLRFEVERIP